MIVGTAGGNEKAKSLTVQTASGPVKAKAIWTMTASGLKRDPFGGISGTVTSLPAAIADAFDICAYSGSLYVSSGRDVIRKIDLSTGDASIFTYGEEDNYFSALRGICEYGGVIYACDGNIIWSVDISTAAVSIFAGWISPGDQTGIGTAARFDTTTGICAGNGYLYVTDTGNNKIKRINITTKEVDRFFGTGFNSNNLDNLKAPKAIDIYGSTVYVQVDDLKGYKRIDIVSKNMENRGLGNFPGYVNFHGLIRRYGTPLALNDVLLMNINNVITYDESSADLGVYTFIAGDEPADPNTIPSSGYQDGVGNIARFDEIRGCCEYNGAVYICDSGNNKIRKLT